MPFNGQHPCDEQPDCSHTLDIARPHYDNHTCRHTSLRRIFNDPNGNGSDVHHHRAIARIKATLETDLSSSRRDLQRTLRHLVTGFSARWLDVEFDWLKILVLTILMKSNKRAKTKSKSKPKTRTKSRTTRRKQTSHASATEFNNPSTPTFAASVILKTCQELEVGDIGGFGSTEELEGHERRCSEQATEFCATCGKNLCHNHYDLLHRDHDHSFQNSGLSQV